MITWITGLIGLSGLRLKLILAGAGLVTALVVVAVIYRQGRKSALADALERTMEKARERIEIKQRQLEAANNRPDRDDLERMLEDGEF